MLPLTAALNPDLTTIKGHKMSELSIEEQYERIKEYFERVFFGYVRNDLDYLMNQELDERRVGGCSVPLALVVLSAINQLGYLTSNKKAKEKETEYYIKRFCNDWMSRIDKLFGKETFQKLLIHFYRHGMAHQFLPIHSVGITRDQKQKIILEFGSGEIYCSIQVKILAETFIQAMDLVYKKIKMAFERDHEFIRRFHLHLRDQIDEYRKKNADLKNQIDEFLKPDEKELKSFTKCTTTVSGTSTSVTA